MTIAVLSDTHGDIEAVGRAVRRLQKRGVTTVVHCGDIGPAVVSSLRGMRTYFVSGNTDDPDELGRAIVGPEHTFHGPLGTLEIEGRRIAFLHGHDARLLQQTVRSGQWDLVCRGHSHTYSSRMEGRTLVLDPAPLRTADPSLAVVELPSLEVTRIPLPARGA